MTMKRFENPEISVSLFCAEDIVTTSGNFSGAGDTSGAWGDNELPR